MEYYFIFQSVFNFNFNFHFHYFFVSFVFYFFLVFPSLQNSYCGFNRLDIKNKHSFSLERAAILQPTYIKYGIKDIRNEEKILIAILINKGSTEKW